MFSFRDFILIISLSPLTYCSTLSFYLCGYTNGFVTVSIVITLCIKSILKEVTKMPFLTSLGEAPGVGPRLLRSCVCLSVSQSQQEAGPAWEEVPPSATSGSTHFLTSGQPQVTGVGSLACLQRESCWVSSARIPPPPWGFLLVLFHPLPPTLLLEHKGAVFRIEPCSLPRSLFSYCNHSE